jgi:hypothetical protein
MLVLRTVGNRAVPQVGLFVALALSHSLPISIRIHDISVLVVEAMISSGLRASHERQRNPPKRICCIRGRPIRGASAFLRHIVFHCSAVRRRIDYLGVHIEDRTINRRFRVTDDGWRTAVRAKDRCP